MRIFKTKVFARFARSAGLGDKALRQAANEVEKGLVDAALGGNLFKKRVALPGRGKRGGARTILVHCKSPVRMFFLYGFPKNVKDNLSDVELLALKRLEKEYSKFRDEQIKTLIDSAELQEIENGDAEEEDNG